MRHERPKHSQTLILPDLSGSGCFYFEACGRLQPLKKPRHLNPKIARVRLRDRSEAYLRLIEGGGSDLSVRHLHLDLAIVRVFTASRPKVRYKRAAIERNLARYFGERIDVMLYGQFGFRAKDIPAGAGVVLAGPHDALSTINGTSVEIVSSSIVLREDGFVNAIDWQSYEGKTVFVDIFARCEIEVSPSYLEEMFTRLAAACRFYTLGRNS